MEAEGKSGVGPEGRWRSFDYDELMKRDKANLDIFWLKDKSLANGDDLPEPDVLAQEIADDLQTALASGSHHFGATGQLVGDGIEGAGRAATNSCKSRQCAIEFQSQPIW